MRRVQENRREGGDRSARKFCDVLGRWTKIVLDFERSEHGPRSPALEVGKVGREVRAEDQDPVARVENRLGEILLERLGPRGHDDVFAPSASSQIRP